MATGVNWDINIKAPASEAKKADTVVEQLEKHLKQVDSAADHAGKKFHDMGSHAARAGEHSHSLFKELFSAELAAHAVEHLVELVKELGKEALKAAADEQRMMRVFEANFGSKEAGEEAEHWADVLAERTELTEAQTEGAMIGLKRVGATAEKAKLAMKAAADVAAVSANGPEAFAATIEAFERIQRTGQISIRALAPLGIGVKDFKTLDSMRGKSTEQIKKLMEEGKVDRNDLFRLVMSRTNEKAIGQRAADNSDLLATKLAKLQEWPERFFKKLANTKGIESLSHSLGVLLEKIDPDSPFGKKAVGFMETVFNAGTGALDYLISKIDDIDFDALGKTVQEDVLPAVKAVIDLINPMIDAIERVVRGFHRMHDIMVGPTPANQALDDFERRQKAAAARAAAEDEPAFLQKGVDVGGGARAWHGKFHVVGEKAADGMEAGAKKGLGIHSPSVVFEDIGAMTALGFAGGFKDKAPAMDRALERMFETRGVHGGAAGGIMGGVSLTFGDIIFQVHGGGDAEETGRRAADAFKKEIRGELFSLIEQMRAEAGA